MARPRTAERAAALLSRRGGPSGAKLAEFPVARTVENGKFTPAQVSEIQRARVLSAMFDLADEHDGGEVSVAHVVERSGISRRTFYEAFADREDCFLAAFERALELSSERVLPAFQAERKWSEQIRAGLFALLSFFDEEPSVGRLLIVASASAGPNVLELRARRLAQVAEAIDVGRAQSANGASLPPLTAEGLVGGVLSVIAARLVRGKREPLSGLVSQLMSMIVLPYQGAGAARRELERPTPTSGDLPERAALLADPFKDMGMRLTYRTVRVLLAVAECPGASNRQLGDSAEITDQGQISKLLGRLQRLELISNAGLGPGMGTPNVWSLTEKGERFTKSIRTHTQHINNPGEASSC